MCEYRKESDTYILPDTCTVYIEHYLTAVYSYDQTPTERSSNALLRPLAAA